MAERNPSNDRAAFGVFPQLKRNRSKQDREAAKNVPVDLARGAISGVLGAPGDIESLIRMLPYIDEKTILPTSEDIEKKIPFKSDTPVSRAATGLGQLGGGFYYGPGSPLKVVGALPKALKHGAEEFAKASVAGVPHVIKPKGGNWFGDSVEKALDPLLTKGMINNRNIPYGPEFDVAIRKRIEDLQQAASQPDYKGGAGKVAEHLTRELENPRANEAALNKWVQSNLTNYVKKEMATPEDPIRRLAEQGITHFPIAEDATYWARKGESARQDLGGTQMAQSDLAKQWENRTDPMFSRDTAEQHQDMMHLAPGMYSDKDEWIKKLSPEINLFSAKQNVFNRHDLGFDHIMDVLRQDVAEGRIRPDQLNKVSMEQAVRRTYEYDQEMAKRMREAAIKQQEGFPVYKEYPEGYKWIELAPQPKDALRKKHEEYVRRDFPDIEKYDPYGFEEYVKDSMNSSRVIDQQQLADALKYEGNTMGHCVGGYCPDVVEGKSRIFSLRDAKGEPHVTVEVRPKSSENYALPVESWFESQPQEVKNAINEAGYKGYNVRYSPQYKEALSALPPDIIQIKGKQNAAPKTDYLPYVQDFVRSGKWGDVGDLKNTGLYKADPEELGMFLPNDINLYDMQGKRTDILKRAKEAGLFPEGQKYLTRDEWEDILRKQSQAEQAPKPDVPPAEGMKAGGVVISKNPDAMMLELGNKRMKQGGSEDDAKPYFGGAGTKKYAAAKKRAEQADVNQLKDPKTYAAIMGLLGEAPDQMGFSVLHPDYQGIKEVADPAFYAGTALGVAPVAKAFKAPAMALGRAGERYAEKVVPQIMERGGLGAEILGGLAQGTRSNVYLPHTPKKPDPNVGSRYKTEHVGNLAPKHEFDIEANQDSSVMVNPWDLTSRGEKVLEVSDTPLIEPIITEGGHDFARDLAHIQDTIGGASGRQIAERMQDRVNDAYFANMLDKGTGRVFTMPSTMDVTGSNYSTMPTDVIMDFFKQAELKPKDVNRITDDLRSFMFETERGKFKNAAPVGSPEFLKQLREGGEGFSAGDLRKGFMDRMSKAEYQKMLGYNIEDVYGAIHDPSLKGVPKGFVGNTMIETSPFAEIRPSTHQSYDSANAGKYAGSMPSMPIELMMPDLYEYLERQVLSSPKSSYKEMTPMQIRTMIINMLEKRGSMISQPINQRVVDNVMRYKEGLKQGHFKPNDYDSIMEFMRRTGGYKEGGEVTKPASGAKQPAAYIDGNEFVLAAKKYGIKDSMNNLNKIVDLVNKGLSVDDAARQVADTGMHKAAGGAITGDDLIIEERPL